MSETAPPPLLGAGGGLFSGVARVARAAGEKVRVLEELRRQASESLPRGIRLSEHGCGQRRGRAALRLALAVLLVPLIVLALLALFGEIPAADHRVARVLAGWSAPALYWLMLAVSWLGWQPQAGLIGVGLTALLCWKRLTLESGFALLALVGGTPVYLLCTLLWYRVRPHVVVAGIRGYKELGGTSFPSGHVINYLLFCGFLAYVTYTLVQGPVVRRALLAPALALIVLVGFSRLYLGQHWLSDVLASYAIGGALLVALLAAYRVAKRRQLARLEASAGRLA